LSAISAAVYGLIGKEEKIGKKTEISVFIKSYNFQEKRRENAGK
jgi:hypothetical protein